MLKKILTIVGILLIAFNVMAYEIQDTPKTIAKRYTSPDSISAYLMTYYEYISDTLQFDKEDYWQTPKEMIKNKQGDCEDFAVLTYAILKELNIESQIVAIWGIGKDVTKTHKWWGHAICVFQIKGKYSLMSNMYYFAYRSNSLIELMDKYVPNWYSITIYDANERVIEEIDNENWIDPAEEKEGDKDEE